MEPPNIPNLITYSYVCLLLLNVLFDALASLLMEDVYTAFAIPSMSWHCQQMSCVYTLSACILPLLHEPILLSFQPFVASDSIQHPSDSSGLSKRSSKASQLPQRSISLKSHHAFILILLRFQVPFPHLLFIYSLFRRSPNTYFLRR